MYFLAMWENITINFGELELWWKTSSSDGLQNLLMHDHDLGSYISYVLLKVINAKYLFELLIQFLYNSVNRTSAMSCILVLLYTSETLIQILSILIMRKAAQACANIS